MSWRLAARHMEMARTSISRPPSEYPAVSFGLASLKTWRLKASQLLFDGNAMIA
jgi:hypothetical protein